MVFGLLRRAKKGAIGEPSADNKQAVQQALKMGNEAIRDMNKRMTHLDERIKECVEEAKRKHANNDKQGALGALRRKKLYEEEVARISASIMTLESQNITLEGAQMQQLALSALSTGVTAHKKLQQHMATREVDELMEQLEEQRDAQAEIHDAMTQGLSLPTEFEDELEALIQEEKMKEAAESQQLEEIATEPAERPTVQPAQPVATAPLPQATERAKTEEPIAQ
ncbi:SNF7-RELATED, putative [Babesia bigemina]|uniref:SNF7-RELATED, putative n=1 Tax=Babesia bigemina TaxID=5866 RepID=A0A061DDU6_BABBI|nr:SNF7-RELATED, putative [Babesia bigemina]CDR96585.1 SNF7-RELATED, putative [Babesia bigemina]|eukprot:XP_012768771.1 SNF7-RELATED, putative [Babesia bigemina]